MDYIREFDIQLEREHFYAGESVCGNVILDTVENFKLRSTPLFSNRTKKIILETLAIRVVLRGKAHAEWKVMLSGDRRTVKGDQYFLDQRQTIWGEKNLNSTIPILPRGVHKFPFK